MIKNYIIIVFRILWRQKLYSILNILGLALALAVSFIILNHVRVEWSYDKHFPKADRLYRIINKTVGERGNWDWAPTAPLMAEEIQKYVPEIEKLVRFRYMNETVLVNRSDTNNLIQFKEDCGYYADSTVFDVFDLKMLYGDKNSALSELGSLVLTESLAKKYFGDKDPVGEHLYSLNANQPFTVTGVIADFPETSHFKIDFLVDWKFFKALMKAVNLEDLYNLHGWAGVYTYAQVQEDTKGTDLTDKLFNFRVNFYGGDTSPEDITGEFFLQPITDIHLKSNLEQEMGPNGNIAYVIVFFLSAIFILIIAGVNYVNIAITRSLKRTKEVAIRKVNGAKRLQLIHQFQSESLITVLFSAILSILFIDLILPVYNQLTGSTMVTLEIFTTRNIMLFLLIILFLGSVSGLYPSLFASRFKPVMVFKEMSNPKSISNTIRKVLVVLQFSISIFMILSTIIIHRQMHFFNEKNLGFDKSRVININLNGELRFKAVNNPQTVKAELGKLPFVIGSSVTSSIIGDRFSVEGLAPDSKPEDWEDPSLRFLRVDEEFLELLNIKLLEGRNFNLPPEKESQYILNNRAVQLLDLEEPVGEKGTSFFGQYGEIIGVVDDFHFASLHHKIDPLVLECNADPEFRGLWVGNMLVKLTKGDHIEMIHELEEAIGQFAPGTTFNFEFLDDKLNQLYASEANLRDIFKYFAIFTIFISCLGLFGLSSYVGESRTKEIGIRKSMGANTSAIAILMSKQFLGFVLIGLLIALPSGYFYMNDWLRNFAYKIHLQPWEFLLAGLLALIIAIISISFQAIRAAMKNPADALHYE